MAEKMIFVSTPYGYYGEALVEYDYYGGFAVSQKQKCIASLHSYIEKKYPGKKVLEISTKSPDELGVSLSAFNLMFFHEGIKEYRHIENVFQSSKVFAEGGPYVDLLDVKPKDAKRDERLKTSGPLTHFELYGKEWPLVPRTMFYDWLYINALMANTELAKGLLDYDIFTDIEFNYKKQLNCQARAAAIFVALHKKGELETRLASPESFRDIYG